MDAKSMETKTRGILKEFKEFAMKGNLIDMAVAFVMGASFGKVVSAFVDGMVMPVVGKLSAGVDLKALEYVLSQPVMDPSGKILSPAVVVRYGQFIMALVDFLIVAFVMFMLIKAMNEMKRVSRLEDLVSGTTPAPPPPSAEEKLLAEIRDLLRDRKG